MSSHKQLYMCLFIEHTEKTYAVLVDKVNEPLIAGQTSHSLLAICSVQLYASLVQPVIEALILMQHQ